MMDKFYKLIRRLGWLMLVILINLFAGLVFLVIYPVISGMDDALEGY